MKKSLDRPIWILFLAAFLQGASAFAAPYSDFVNPAAHRVKCEDTLYLPTAVVAQKNAYTCGLACFASFLLSRFGRSLSQNDLAIKLGTTSISGTDPSAIVGLAQSYGFYSREETGATIADLWRYLVRGETVFVGWQLEGVGHYSLVRGLGYNHITLMDPWYARQYPGKYRRIAVANFIPTWYLMFGQRRNRQIIRVSPNPLEP